jgi:hypothetical protein
MRVLLPYPAVQVHDLYAQRRDLAPLVGLLLLDFGATPVTSSPQTQARTSAN